MEYTFQQSESIKNLAAALSLAQGQMGWAIKDKSNPYFKSNYADLASVTEAIRKPLVENGLSVVQFPMGIDCLITQLMHLSGEWIRATFQLKIKDELDPQKRGSALTYARRYCLMAVCGIAPSDDDGNLASQPPITVPSKAKPTHLSPEQIKDLVNIAQECGVGVEDLKKLLKDKYNIENSKDMTLEIFTQLVAVFKSIKLEQGKVDA